MFCSRCSPTPHQVKRGQWGNKKHSPVVVYIVLLCSSAKNPATANRERCVFTCCAASALGDRFTFTCPFIYFLLSSFLCAELFVFGAGLHAICRRWLQDRIHGVSEVQAVSMPFQCRERGAGGLAEYSPCHCQGRPDARRELFGFHRGVVDVRSWMTLMLIRRTVGCFSKHMYLKPSCSSKTRLSPPFYISTANHTLPFLFCPTRLYFGDSHGCRPGLYSAFFLSRSSKN